MGVVRAVVVRAMMTIMAKMASVMTPSSRPTLRMTSSIRPRVFIRMPIAPASRHGMPQARAARALPPNFPAHAVTITRPQKPHMAGVSSTPMRVRRPV